MRGNYSSFLGDYSVWRFLGRNASPSCRLVFGVRQRRILEAIKSRPRTRTILRLLSFSQLPWDTAIQRRAYYVAFFRLGY